MAKVIELVSYQTIQQFTNLTIGTFKKRKSKFSWQILLQESLISSYVGIRLQNPKVLFGNDGEGIFIWL